MHTTNHNRGKPRYLYVCGSHVKSMAKGWSKPVKDMTGQVIGKWHVEKYLGAITPGQTTTYYLCVCDCGTERPVNSSALRKRVSQSCGCYHNELAKQQKTIHGLSAHPLRNHYHAMKSRCENPNNVNYKNYGMRGIEVCEEWRNSYPAFVEWALANGWEKGLTLDRIDNDGPYAPWNCRWITRQEQLNNTRRNRYYTYNGKTQTLTQWSVELNIPYERLRGRIRKGQHSLEEAVTMEENYKIR